VVIYFFHSIIRGASAKITFFPGNILKHASRDGPLVELNCRQLPWSSLISRGLPGTMAGYGAKPYNNGDSGQRTLIVIIESQL
jgi:hypothetical protein